MNDIEEREGSPHQSQITSVDADDGIGDLAIGDGDGILCGGILEHWLYLSDEPAHRSFDVFANLIRSDAAIVKSLLEGTSRGVIDKNTSCLDAWTAYKKRTMILEGRNSQAESRVSRREREGMTDATEYSVVSIVDPPASQMANSTPGYIEKILSASLLSTGYSVLTCRRLWRSA